jgi:hypothetical protein
MDKTESLQRQLDEEHNNLLMIQERKTTYLLETEIPLQLIREEQRVRERITKLEALGHLPQKLHQ